MIKYKRFDICTTLFTPNTQMIVAVLDAMKTQQCGFIPRAGYVIYAFVACGS